MKEKMNLLRMMNDIILTQVDDEEVIMTWLTYGVPDEPCDDDFEFIASDDEEFVEICSLFARCLKEDM